MLRSVAGRQLHSGRKRIKTPTLLIGSDQDPSTPWEGNGEVLARGISGAKSVLLGGTHLSNLEQPKAFTAALLDFLLPGNHARRAG
jgi:pimeloyl-ACP methyl ester carboxylesterase